MAADDTSEAESGDRTDVTDGIGTDPDGDAESEDVRERIEREADRAVEQFDESVVDLLSWALDTETRARIYVSLRQQPDSTSDEVAEETGLYPSTVREALAELHEEGKVRRQKRENSGAGNNPYEYSAIAPSELVGEIVDDVQGQLNAVFNLDRYLDGETEGDRPVEITVEDSESGHDSVPDTRE
jgi:predicted transcriptional regulator